MNKIDNKLIAFGERLKLAIKERFKFQKEFAKVLDVKEETLSNWIKGRTFPDNIDILTKISEALEVSTDWLLFGKSYNNNEINPDMFDEVYYHTYKWASKEGFPTNGSFFLGVYDMVVEELKKDSKVSIENIIDRIKPTILKLRKIK